VTSACAGASCRCSTPAAFFRAFDRRLGDIHDDELDPVVGGLKPLLTRQLEGPALCQNIFHPADDAADARLVEAPTRGEVEEGAVLAPIPQSQQDLILDRELRRTPRLAATLRQAVGDDFDHLAERLRLRPAVALEIRGGKSLTRS